MECFWSLSLLFTEYWLCVNLLFLNGWSVLDLFSEAFLLGGISESPFRFIKWNTDHALCLFQVNEFANVRTQQRRRRRQERPRRRFIRARRRRQRRKLDRRQRRRRQRPSVRSLIRVLSTEAPHVTISLCRKKNSLLSQFSDQCHRHCWRHHRQRRRRRCRHVDPDLWEQPELRDIPSKNCLLSHLLFPCLRRSGLLDTIKIKSSSNCCQFLILVSKGAAYL